MAVSEVQGLLKRRGPWKPNFTSLIQTHSLEWLFLCRPRIAHLVVSLGNVPLPLFTLSLDSIDQQPPELNRLCLRRPEVSGYVFGWSFVLGTNVVKAYSVGVSLSLVKSQGGNLLAPVAER